MPYIRSLILSLLAIAAVPAIVLSADLWTEDFTGQEGKGMYGSDALGLVTNMTGITAWTVSGAAGLDDDGSLNWWMVTNGVFEGQDVGSPYGYWQSESIDVSSNDHVQIAMDFAQVGDGLDGTDNKFVVGYRLDGGTEQMALTIEEDSQSQFDGQTWTSIAIDASSATSVTIEVTIRASTANDGWSFDNVALQTAATDQPPFLSGIGAKSATSGSDLVFDVTASDLVDGDVITLSASNLPPGAVFAPTSAATSVTNTFSWNSVNPVGVYTTTFYAVDNDGTASETVEISVAGFPGGLGKIWINEIHYDDNGAGGDTNEGFEVAGPAGTDLSEYTVYHYNGSGGATYDTTPLTGTIDNEIDNHGAVWFGGPRNYMQNGAPDGLALVHVGAGNTNLLQFISYEGDFIGTAGPADGIGSTDIGVSEPSTTPVGESLQLTGRGDGYVDFMWIGPTNHSRGLLNAGQSIRIGSTILIVR